MIPRRAAGVLLALAVLAAPAAAAPDIRTATPRDNGAHEGPGDRTEWWFVSAVDPAQDLAVAVALGAEFPGAPPQPWSSSTSPTAGWPRSGPRAS